MIAQSVSELIAKTHRKANVLFTALNGRKSTEYIYGEPAAIDEYKMQLHSGMGIEKSMLRPYKKTENLYIIAGVEKEEEARNYFPDNAYTLLESLYGAFDVIVVDTGSELDNGLALGAMKKGGFLYLVLEQAESSIGRYERMRELYARMGIGFNRYLINQFVENDPYTLSYIASRLTLNKDSLIKIDFCESGRQAELERKTLLELNQERYKKNILRIANEMMEMLHMDEITLQRKRKWTDLLQ